MDIIKKLIAIANSLDKRGLYKEAQEIDELIKSAYNWNNIENMPGMGGVLNRGPDPRNIVTDIADLGEQERKERPTGQAGMGERKRKVAAWQKKYNRAIAGSGIKPLKIDGIWGPATNGVYKIIKQIGWNGIRNVAKKRIEKAKQKQSDIQKLVEQDQLAGNPIAQQDQATIIAPPIGIDKVDVTEPGYGGYAVASNIRQIAIQNGAHPSKIDNNLIMRLLQNGHKKQEIVNFLVKKYPSSKI